MKKKILKIVGIFLLLVLALLIALPFLLEGKIAEVIKNKVNKNINASLDFEDADLSLLGSFPNAEVQLKGITLLNHAPYEGDTLFASEYLKLKMGISELFKGTNDAIGIKSLVVDKALLNIRVDSEEHANYDIAKASDDDTIDTSGKASGGFSLDLESYQINDSKIVYDDRAGGLKLMLDSLNHSGSGDLSLESSELQTQTNALVSFEMDSTNYLNNNAISLDALIGIDLNENKYSFLKNEALVNQLPLVFDGFVKVNEANQEVDVNFKTPSSDFKNFLAVIPEAYSKNIENVQTTGNFEVSGQFKGLVDEDHIPTFLMNIKSENASFKYPDLPKAVKNVYIDTEVVNSTGITEDTFVNIKKLSFQIDEDRFNMVSRITDLLGNTKVNADLNGTLNLANLSKAYPVPSEYDLSGVLTADVKTAFDMAAVENHQYEKTMTSGNMGLRGFEYSSPEMKNPVAIKTADVSFNPTTVSLDSFEGETGQTDFSATGTIDNLLGYVFNDENIEGNFKLSSNTLTVNDFMVSETPVDESGDQDNGAASEEKIKIPSFLDCTIDASVNSVQYDNLNLTDVSGRLLIKDQTATLQNLTSSIFGGKLNLNGKVSTKPDVPVFNMALGVDGFKISESFQSMELLKVLAPVAKLLEGKLNSSIKLSGDLKDDLTPNLATLSGDMLAELLATEISEERTPLVAALDGQLNFINLKELDLSGLKTAMNFDNGKVRVKPFDLKYKDIAIQVNGGHTFDQQLQYAATMQVPAKYLGQEVNNLIAQMNDESLKNLTIPVTANIGGAYTSPNVTTDLTSGVKKVTAQLVEIKKQQLVNKGKDTAKNLIGGLFEKDSAQTDSSKTSVGGVLGRMIGNDKKATTANDSAATQKDAITAEGQAEKAAKSILGGLLGKKKKKDSVN